MIRGDSRLDVSSSRRIHSLFLDSICNSFGIFGETHKGVSWSAREPMVYCNGNLIEGPDLVIVYGKIDSGPKAQAIPVELKTGNVTQRDVEKAQHQLWMGTVWLEEVHRTSVPYGVLVKADNKGKINWERIDRINLRY